MNDPNPLIPPPQPRRPGLTTRQKLVLGAAMVIVPGTFAGYLQFQKLQSDRDKWLDEELSYDDPALRRIDAKLIGYHQVARFETAVPAPSAMTVSHRGDVIIAGNGVLHRLSASGAQLQVVTFDGRAWCVATDEADNVYVGLRDRVEVYDAAGKRTAAWASFGSRSHLTSIAIDRANVWVADAGERIVHRLDRGGKPIGKIAGRDDSRGIPGLVVPSPHLDVAVGSDGVVWVANPGKHRLEGYSPDGQLERFWGTAGANVESFFGCCNPSDFALLSDGSFITAEKGIARIKHHHADGRFDCAVVSPEAFATNRSGMELAVNPGGQVLVLERGTRTVRIYDRGGDS